MLGEVTHSCEQDTYISESAVLHQDILGRAHCRQMIPGAHWQLCQPTRKDDCKQVSWMMIYQLSDICSHLLRCLPVPHVTWHHCHLTTPHIVTEIQQSVLEQCQHIIKGENTQPSFHTQSFDPKWMMNLAFRLYFTKMFLLTHWQKICLWQDHVTKFQSVLVLKCS